MFKIETSLDSLPYGTEAIIWIESPNGHCFGLSRVFSSLTLAQDWLEQQGAGVIFNSPRFFDYLATKLEPKTVARYRTYAHYFGIKFNQHVVQPNVLDRFFALLDPTGLPTEW